MTTRDEAILLLAICASTPDVCLDLCLFPWKVNPQAVELAIKARRCGLPDNVWPLYGLPDYNIQCALAECLLREGWTP